MPRAKNVLKAHATVAFFLLAFAFSWGLSLIVVAPAGFPLSMERPEFAVAIALNELGPALAVLLLIALVYGESELLRFRAALFKWRARGRWYGVALLTVPLLVVPILAVLSLASPGYVPQIVEADYNVSFLLMGIGVGLFAGIFEEAGWTGLATPKLLQRHGILAAGLILGFLWAAWHMFLGVWFSGDSGGRFSPDAFLPPFLFFVGVLPAYRVLMVWVYDRTRSLPVGMLMHASLTANTTMILMPSATEVLVPYYLVLATTLWVAVGAIVLVNHGHITRKTARSLPMGG